MGWGDWMSQPIGGYTDVQPEAISNGAEFGQGGGFEQANSGMTWGQLIGAIAKMSNSQSGQMLSSYMGNQFGVLGSGVPQQSGTSNTGATPAGASPQIYQIGPNSDFNKPDDKGDSMGMIMGMASGAGFI